MRAVQPAPARLSKSFDPRRLERVFARCFAREFRTRLLGGAAEPLYRPAPDGGGWHLLHYREDFFASALHEVAHWCIAGAGRRRRVDFGYWYAPEGRGPVQQRAFEAVESKPQALEWHFARACGYRFILSLDNLDPGSSGEAERRRFAAAVAARAEHWRSAGLPPRAEHFCRALAQEYGTAVESLWAPFDPALLA